MEENSFIIEGPMEDQHHTMNHLTIGKIFYECLKKRSPDEILYVDAVTDDVITCGKLLKDSIRAVKVLNNLGIQKDDVVTIVCENALEYIVPLVAAFFMGVIVNPLNPGYSIGELRHALQISKPKLILCSSCALENIKELVKEFDSIPTLLILGNKNATETSVLAAHFQTLLQNVCNGDYCTFEPESFDASNQSALILMSSGTTGLPKGVMITHQNLKTTLTITGAPRCGGLKSGDIMVLILPIFHVYGMQLFLTAIHLRTKVILLDKFQLGLYLGTIERYKANKLQIVPPLVLVLADINVVKNYDLSSVEDVLVGGAPVANKSVQDVITRLPNVNFREVYGLTEVCSGCAFLKTYPKEANCVGSIAPFLKVKVWDSANGTSLGAMEVGELCFKGPSVMKGYIGVSTNNVILDSDGFYHSGDLGYYDSNGLLYVVDRIKELIKYKGFQVSPVELEQLLLTHPSIKDCGVIGIPDKKAGQLPLACVVRHLDSSVTENEIVEFVKERISFQKRLHGGVTFIDEIPKSQSGKILRKKLEEIMFSIL